MEFLLVLLLLVGAVYGLRKAAKASDRRDHAQRVAWLSNYVFPAPFVQRLPLVLQIAPEREYMAWVHAIQSGQHTWITIYSRVHIPSALVQRAWEEFRMLDTDWRAFCEAMQIPLRYTLFRDDAQPRFAHARAWVIACQREQIDPLYPHHLPFLYALDHSAAPDVYAERPLRHPVELHKPAPWIQQLVDAWQDCIRGEQARIAYEKRNPINSEGGGA
jgi:hypothetical protein